MNRLSVFGRVVRTPKLEETNSGTKYTRFTIASNSRGKDENGEPSKIFFDCIAWRGLAETITKFFGKGDRIVAYGELNQREYENTQGQTVKKFDFNVDNVDFVENKTEKDKNREAEEKETKQQELQEVEDVDNLPF
jgi:single-strand DNA-binding protein